LQAVEKTSFVVQKGEILGIIGPNGAGKTSLFEMLTMNKKRSRGEVKLMNVPITSSKLKQKDLGPKIGIVNQSNSIWHEMTVYQSLQFLACIKGVLQKDIEFHIEFINGQLDLAPYTNIKCKNLSGGNKRKLCSAMSFVGSPTL
jgi:ABC-type multidrug transport system ATPase subunit